MTSILDKLGNKDLINDEVIATGLLVSTKSAVRTYAVAITETANPDLHELLKKQMNEAIDLHHKVATYMIENGMYHAHDIKEQLDNDMKKADLAMEMPADNK